MFFNSESYAIKVPTLYVLHTYFYIIYFLCYLIIIVFVWKKNIFLRKYLRWDWIGNKWLDKGQWSEIYKINNNIMSLSQNMFITSAILFYMINLCNNLITNTIKYLFIIGIFSFVLCSNIGSFRKIIKYYVFINCSTLIIIGHYRPINHSEWKLYTNSKPEVSDKTV